MPDRLRAAIVGATGYTSLELLRWLLRHPQVKVTVLASRKTEQPISEIFPELLGRIDLPIEPFEPKVIAQKADIAFLCVPHATAMQYAPELLSVGLRVIDLSADYRLKDTRLYEKWYKHPHTDAENLAHAVYGLPDLFARQIASAKLIANPGCYTTSAILPLAPLVKAGLIDSRVRTSIKTRSPLSNATKSSSPFGQSTRRATTRMRSLRRA